MHRRLFDRIKFQQLEAGPEEAGAGRLEQAKSAQRKPFLFSKREEILLMCAIN